MSIVAKTVPVNFEVKAPLVSPIVTQANTQTVAAVTTQDTVEKVIDQPVDTLQLQVEKRLEVTKHLLSSGQPEIITLQILSSANDEQLKLELAKLSQQLEIDNIYLYRKKQKGVNLTMFLYGAFSSRTEALAALKALPSQIKNNRPNLRTLGGINKEIEQAQ